LDISKTYERRDVLKDSSNLDADEITEGTKRVPQELQKHVANYQSSEDEEMTIADINSPEEEKESVKS
jgi:hypothetical protein